MSTRIDLRVLFGIALLGTTLTAGAAFAQEAKLYWTEVGLVRRSNLDGTMIETIATSVGGNQDIELDVGAGKVYWVASSEIRRRNLDGTGSIESFDPAGASGVQGIGLDPVAGHIYFTTPAQANRMSRADLTPLGNNETLIVHFSNPTGTGPWDVDVDRVSSTPKLYWADQALGPLMRSDLDGMNIETVVGGSGDAAHYLAVNVLGDLVYWDAANTNNVRRAHLDGSGVEVIQSGGSFDNGLALDLAGAKLYYVEAGGIHRINLDGSGTAELIVPGLTQPVGLAILPAAPPVPALPGAGPVLLVLALIAATGLALGRSRAQRATR